jgi:tRNA(Ile)-lysidine synthase
MQPARALAAGTLNRPLLSLARANLETYAAQHALSWVEDESNVSLNFDRNFLRHQIMPQLQQRWPGFTQRWQQSAELCAQSAILDEQLAASDLMACGVRAERLGWSLNLEPLRTLTGYRRGNLLRYWLAQQWLATPEQKHLEQVEAQLLRARADAKSQVVWGQGAERLSLRVYKERLYLLPELEQVIPSHVVSWPVAQPLVWGGWELRAEPATKTGMGVLLPETVEVRMRRGGERCRPVGRRHSQSLKKLLQEAALEPWLREQLPLIYSDETLLAVGDLWGCEGAVDKTAQRYCLSWQWVGQA